MKKIFLTAALIVGVAVSANAQNVDFGVKAGANFSNLEFESTGISVTPDGRTGFYVGGIADISVSEKFSVQPEVVYSSEGAEDASVDFINVPIMAKYYVASGLSLQAGPQIGILVDAEGGTDGLKSTNFGLNAGLGYDLKDMGLYFDARYNFGLSDISDVDGIEVNTKGFQIGVGYKF